MSLNNSKIKILFVLDSLSFGGREKAVFDLANGLAEERFEVSILSFSNDSIDQVGLINKNIKTICMPFKRNSLGGISALLFWMKGLPIYLSILRKINPDIVHTHLLFQQFLFGSIGIRLSQVKAIHFHTVHTAGLYFANKSLINQIRLATEKFAVWLNRTYIISVSETVQEICVKYFQKQASKILCINNGVDTNKFDYKLRDRIERTRYGFSAADIIVVYVARMDAGKDHMTLLKAWLTIANTNNNAKLCLVGSGELENTLRKFVIEHHLDLSVTFIHNTPDIQYILAIADIAVFPSLFEGLPISLLEKMFMKLPIIGSNIGAVRSIVKEGYNGLLFEPKDHQALAIKLDRMLSDRAFRYYAAKNAWLSVQNYNLDTMIKKHIEIYEVSTNH